ncbi:TonB-dependent receptor domain-containing protein [Aequorivita echinoideorum]|uniref:TonB-dependent receptor domain-containing protein n=1 Tax=Aequorivita echinoideorum TaxID=1549647 RepID=UPI00293D8B5F|nr:TonB-dependent receptor [Aequorivita echinoideorum]
MRYDYGYIHTKPYFDWFPSQFANGDGTSSAVFLQRAVDKSLHFSNITGSAGVSYVLNDVTYKLNIAKGFRMPLANELASDGVNYHMYRYERGNLELEPEESYQLDFDVDYTWKNLRVGLSPFVSYFTNFIYLNPTPTYFETLQIYEYTQNKVSRIGGELSVGYTIAPGLVIDVSGEFVRSRQLDGPKKNFTLPFSPPLTFLTSTSYILKNDIATFRNLRFQFDWRKAAAQREIVPPEEKTDGYSLFNLSVTGNIKLTEGSNQPEFRIRINNLFNTKYFNHTSFYRLIDVPEAGRNISLSVTVPI